MSRPEITLTGDIPETHIGGGDTVDLGTWGVLIWLTDEDADAYRLWQRKRQREIRTTIDHVEKRTGIG